MLKVFNAFQMVLMFAAWPFVIDWLADQSFQYRWIAGIIACLVYIVMFCVAVGMTAEQIGKD